ncbi:hypothetical protein KDL01_29200 [Actinospica durhamensis]|uniref:Uncharacterized protein n=1 Tax=Actinospica durhamensis TaxID=1508375 RepID=A0A941ESR5_9ACTN|nr:hypothetical protein [Actinospica durhamensis]MBR7837392.1 hypothetical protein [Actinospica durhamensis]
MAWTLFDEAEGVSMQALPVVARRRILSKVRTRLSAEADRALPSHGIPVPAAGWNSVLHDLAHSGRAASLAQTANVLASARDAGELRESGEEFVDQPHAIAHHVTA